MGRLSGKTPSPAMVVAIAALVFAVAGTAIAGVATVSVLSKKEKKTVKKISNQAIDQRAPGLSVASAGRADSATNATSAANATTAASAENADLLDGLSAAAFQSSGKGVAANAGAPNVAGLSVLGLIPTTPTAIVTLTGAAEGQMVTLVAGNANVSATDSGAFNLAGNWAGVNQGDTLTLVNLEGGWNEVARSNN